MKSILSKLPLSSDTSFLYKNVEGKCINDPWHFHKEYELILINESTGTRFVGDNVSHFREGCLTLIGSNIPHLFRNDEDYYSNTSTKEASLTYLLFSDDFLGTHFFQLPEMKLVERLLQKSSLALEISGKTKKWVSKKLHDMNNQKPPQRLIYLLEILVHLSHSREMKPLLTMGFSANRSGETEKINEVFEFIMKNYTDEIYVQNIASKLHMSVASFSRYFKYHTRKTFSDYVTEIRIGHACRLLMEDNYNISEISYKSGFENSSNFYRHFRKITGVIPKDYKSRFLNSSNY